MVHNHCNCFKKQADFYSERMYVILSWTYRLKLWLFKSINVWQDDYGRLQKITRLWKITEEGEWDWVKDPMITSWHGKVFRIAGPLCVEATATDGFPHAGPVTLTFDVFLCDQREQISNKQCSSRWFEMPWCSYQIRKIAGCACAGNAGNVFPATDFNGNC